MNDRRLDELLLKGKVASPSSDQTEDLLFRIRGDLASGRELHARTGRSGQVFFWRWVAGGLAVLVGMLLVSRRVSPGMAPGEKHVAEMRRYLGELQSLFPDRLDAVVFEPAGPRIVLSDRPGFPGNDPVMIRICAGSRCREIVTFSGKRVEIEGGTFEVLADSKGGIIVTGDSGVWTSSNGNRTGGLPFRVQGRHLL